MQRTRGVVRDDALRAQLTHTPAHVEMLWLRGAEVRTQRPGETPQSRLKRPVATTAQAGSRSVRSRIAVAEMGDPSAAQHKRTREACAAAPSSRCRREVESGSPPRPAADLIVLE